MSKDIFKVQMLLAFKKWKRKCYKQKDQLNTVRLVKKGMLILYNCHINTVISTTWLRAEFTAEVLYKQWSKKKKTVQIKHHVSLKIFYSELS